MKRFKIIFISCVALVVLYLGLMLAFKFKLIASPDRREGYYI